MTWAVPFLLNRVSGEQGSSSLSFYSSYHYRGVLRILWILNPPLYRNVSSFII